MYQALYRKWRPRTFEDVVGQDHITDTLRRQVATGRLSHAYLFTGTRGTGKTTCAKILARAVNCERPVDGDPCNECPSCRGIEDGSILDVLELDAASNNGVDQIRALRDEAIYTPAAVRKRVYIVDEVHMLSVAAFNALLKILEEPPAHLMFILATTELQKVPATIKSRCQQFAFKRIAPKTIADRLRYVAGAEGIELAPEAADLLARLADGGLRDGLSLLDQCSGGGAVTEQTVLDTLGLAGNRRTAAILDCAAREDTAGALDALDELYREGKDMGALLSELTTLVRDLLIRKTAPEGGSALLVGGYGEKELRALGQRFTAAELIQCMRILQAAQADLYRSSSRRLDVELCLIRLCDRRLSDTPEGILARLSRLEERPAAAVAAAPQVPSEAPPAAARPAPQEEPPPAPAESAPAPEAPKPEPKPAPPVDPDPPPWDPDPVPPPPPPPPAPAPKRPEPPRPVAAPTATWAEQKLTPGTEKAWQAFVSGCQDVPPMLAPFLRSRTHVVGTFPEGGLILWVESEFVKDMLSKGSALSYIEKAAAAHLGRAVRVQVRVGAPEEPLAPPPEPSAPTPAPQKEEAPPATDPFDALLELGKYDNFTVT